MADDGVSVDESDVRPERRFLLFQLDFANKALAGRLIPRWASPSGRPDVPVAVSDYSDYDNPRAYIYWRNRLLQDWQTRYEKNFKQFSADLFEQVNAGNLVLRRSSAKNPYIDITPFIRSVGNYSVGMSDLSNALLLSIGRPDAASFEDSGTPGISLQDTLSMFNGILPRENDVLMVLVKYPGTQFEPEYLGFVNKVDQGGSYGQIDRYEISVDGITKIGKTSDIIRQQSVSDQLFLPNVEINAKEQVSVFSDLFNDLNVKSIFERINHSVFAIGNQEIPLQLGPRIPYTTGYALDPRPFIPAIVTDANGFKSVQFEGAGFQHNFFALLTIFLMTITTTSDTELFPTKSSASPGAASYYEDVRRLRAAVGGNSTSIPSDDRSTIISPVNRALIDHGDNLAFNLMVANGFSLFYPHMAKASEIFDEVRGTAYYDIFESRDGKIICRPSRYNKIELFIDEGRRQSVESPSALSGIDSEPIFSAQKTKDPDGKDTISFEFNRDADFYIKKEDLADIPSRSFDDEQLDSRSDVKLNLPLAGSQDFPAASYTDPDVLLRFGLKTKPPINNPNALNATAPIIFAPLALAMSNAQARPMSIVVKDTRKYHVGKLYYIEAVDCVAYLTEESIAPGYGTISRRQLTFSMFRRVVRRPLSEIAKQDESGAHNEALNMAMCYMDDPPDTGLVTPQQAAQALGLPAVRNLKELMTQKGLRLVQHLQRRAIRVENPSVVMFRYLPTIVDVAMEVEADPNIATKDPNIDQTGKSSAGKATNSAMDERVLAGSINGFVALTYNFKKPESQQYYEQGFIPAFASAAEGQFSAEAFFAAQKNPRAPLFPAGCFNYGPSADTMYGKTWFEVGTTPSNLIAWYKTPFAASALSEQPQNLRLSQLLANKLASMDVAQKYLPPTDLSNPRIYPNLGSIPQLYYFDGVEFSLFAPGTTPQQFFADRAASGYRVFDAISNIETGPQCLAIDVTSLSEFANEFDPCYRIKGSGGAFKMPYGHFMVVPGPGVPVLSTVQFIRVQSRRNKLLGGSVRITKGTVPGQFILTPADAQTQLVVEDGSGKTFTAGQTYTQAVALKKLYFLTPFAEPTIERLLQFPLPVDVGGQITQDRLNALKDKLKNQPSGGRVFTNNNLRVNGNSINLSPDFLAAASKSDLEIFPRRPLATRVGGAPSGIWRRFESAAFAGEGTQASFKKPDALLAVQDAIKVSSTYPDGTKAPDRLCLVYLMRLSGAVAADGTIGDNRTYAANLTSARSL